MASIGQLAKLFITSIPNQPIMKATEKQLQILRLISNNKEAMTKAEIVEVFKDAYYCNASKHVGDILARMVNKGLLHRPSRGLYQIGGSEKQNVDVNQTSLF